MRSETSYSIGTVVKKNERWDYVPPQHYQLRDIIIENPWWERVGKALGFFKNRPYKVRFTMEYTPKVTEVGEGAD